MEEKNTVPAGTEDAPVKKDRRRIILGAAAVAVAVLVAGGVCAHRAYEGHQVSVARETCQSAVADQSKAMKAYKTLLGADGTVAALKTDAKAVKDAGTVDALAKAAAVKFPAMVKCDASKAADLDAAAAKAAKAAKAVKTDSKALETAVKAVGTSKLDKTVDDAAALYKATDGKVQDAKTRDVLAKAIKARDMEAIAKAVKAVNDSKDAEARAKAEQEAQAQAAAQAAAEQEAQRQAQSASPSYSYANTGSTGGYSYSNAGSGSSSGSAGVSSGSTGASSGSGPISGGHGVGSRDDCDAACMAAAMAPIVH